MYKVEVKGKVVSVPNLVSCHEDVSVAQLSTMP